MLSKSRESVKKICGGLGLGTPHNRSREKATPTCITKGRENMEILRKTIVRHKHRRTMEI